MSSSALRDASELYMPQLDGVRALAVELVFVEHFGGRALNALIPLSAGSVGVNLFFVLSGFLITSILLNAFKRDGAWERPGPVLARFYLRRAIRLMPVLYATIAVAFLLGLGDMRTAWGWHASYTTNVYMALGNPEHVFWSLAVEEQFYLLWPLALLLTGRRSLVPLVLGLILCGLAFKLVWAGLGADPANGNALLPANFEVLGVGALLAILSFDRKAYDFGWYRDRVARAFDVTAAACFGIALAIWFLSPVDAAPRYYLNDLLTAVAFAWLILRAAIGFRGPIGRVLGHPAMIYIGRISYGLYVIHCFVPLALRRPPVVALTGITSPAAINALSIPIAFALAALSWHVLERPLLRLRPRAPIRLAQSPA